MAKRSNSKKNAARIFAGLDPLASTHAPGCRCANHPPKTITTVTPASILKLRHRRNSQRVTLHGGPLDGQWVQTGMETALRLDGHLYCHIECSEDPISVMRHPASWLREDALRRCNDDAELAARMLQDERRKVSEWIDRSNALVAQRQLPDPMSVLIPMHPARIGAHWVCVKYKEPLWHTGDEAPPLDDVYRPVD